MDGNCKHYGRSCLCKVYGLSNVLRDGAVGAKRW